MEDRLTTFHGFFDSVRIANIARKNFEFAFAIGSTVIEPPPGVEGVVENKGAHFVTGPDEGFCKVRSDEAIGTGDEDCVLSHFRLLNKSFPRDALFLRPLLNWGDCVLRHELPLRPPAPVIADQA